jgi:uncharacterized membrane protein
MTVVRVPGAPGAILEPPEAAEEAASARWRSLSLPGAWIALVLACLSFTPSLLPRNGLAQGVVSGISAALGYGLGVLGAATWRSLIDRGARTPPRRAWQALGALGVVAIPVAVVAGRSGQRQLRALMGAPADPWWLVVLTPVVMVAIAVALLALGRGFHRLAGLLTRLIGRWVGQRAARTLGWVAAMLIGFLLVTGVLFDAFITAADQAFSVRDASTADGVEPTTSSLRSGGPGSLIAWDSLGRQGRSFVAGGPSADEIAALRGVADAEEPVRTYAGMATADDVEDRARLAVDDLERAGGFERARLLVATTTGTGWLDPGAMASFEHVAGGDSAIVSLQYSYLPSWISYLVDQPRARAAGRQLFDAVYERWSALPSEERPELYVFGESLGSFGAEAAFSGEFDLANRTDGVLLVGPPAFNVLRREFIEGRDPGSPEVEPVFRGGRTVRFATEVGVGAPPVERAWSDTRVLYLQHPSDPIVWWSTDLLLRRPDWLREPPGRDVLDAMTWIPFVTFWQVSVDMPFAIAVPDGHGHRYTKESVDAWVALLRPDGWAPEDSERLRGLIER